MPDFDPQLCIDDYCEAVANCDDSAINRLRGAWLEWQGVDSLHEMAFGDADE